MKAPKSPYWVWSPYCGERGKAFVNCSVGMNAANGRRLLLGEKLPRAPRVLAMYTGKLLTDALGAYTGWLILAPNLVRVLQAAGARLQLLPLGVARMLHFEPPMCAEEIEMKYVIANVLDTIPALDLERSKTTMYEGTDAIAHITRLKLRPIPADAPPIFHVAEYPVLVLVRDDLRQQLQAASPHPGVFTAAEKYSHRV